MPLSRAQSTSAGTWVAYESCVCLTSTAVTRPSNGARRSFSSTDRARAAAPLLSSGTQHEAHLRAEHKVAIRIGNPPEFLAEGSKHWSRRALEGHLFRVGPVAIAHDSVDKSGCLGPEGRAARAICEGTYKVGHPHRAATPNRPGAGWPGWLRGTTVSASTRSSAGREGSQRADRAAAWAEPRKACLSLVARRAALAELFILALSRCICSTQCRRASAATPAASRWAPLLGPLTSQATRCA
eukprot:scaffold32856_cov74-Phaeocystis_antarctica.AAC.3